MATQPPAMRDKRQPKRRQQPSVIMRIGSLPSIRAASVNILRAKPRDNEIYQFDLQLIPLTFLLTSGVTKARFQMQTAAISLLAGLMACFEEIRFVGARLQPRISYTQFSQGYVKVWIDDAILTAAATTYSDAFSRQTVDVPIYGIGGTTPGIVPNNVKQELQWVATDIEDVDWISIPTGSPASFVPFTVATFAAPGYTPASSAGTGTNATDSSTICLLDGAVRVQLRTLRSA